MTMSLRDEKRELRRAARALREAHAGDEPASLLAAMRERPEWASARVAMLYVPFGTEPPTADLADDLRARGGTVCVPVWDAAEERYALAELPPDAALAPGPGGIPEPVGTARVDPGSVDLFVVPGLLFDRLGTRLGHGRGHLDRLLAARRPGAAVLGLALPWPISPDPLPREPHDVPMDAVLRPRRRGAPLRSALLRLAGLLAVYLVIALPFKAMNLIPGFTDVRPVQALGPLYGVFFGPLGCLACAFGNLVADAADDALRWTSIAGFASNYLGPLFVWWFWTRVSRTPFSLRSPRDLLRHSLVLAASAAIETAIVAPSVALVYPDVDIALFAKAVFGNTAIFPIVLGIPLSILLQEEFGFVPAHRPSRAAAAPT